LPWATLATSSPLHPACRQVVEKRRKGARVGQVLRHAGAVEVGAEHDMVDADPVGHVLDMPHHVRPGRPLGPVEVLGVERDADHPAARTDRVELQVGQIARRRAERVRRGVADDQWPPWPAPPRPRSRAR
jgi:hypothetical protein